MQQREWSVKWRRRGDHLTGKWDDGGDVKLRTDSLIRGDAEAAKRFAINGMAEFVNGCGCEHCRRPVQ